MDNSLDKRGFETRRVLSLRLRFFLIIIFDYTNAYLQQVDDHHNDIDMARKMGLPPPRSTVSTTTMRDSEGEGR